MTLSMCLQRRGSDFAVAQSIVLAGPESTAAPVPIGRVRLGRLAPAAGSTYLQNQERGLTRPARERASLPSGAVRRAPPDPCADRAAFGLPLTSRRMIFMRRPSSYRMAL